MDIQENINVNVNENKEITLEFNNKIIYNKGIPQDLGFVDRSKPENEFELEINFTTAKKQLKKILYLV